MLNRLRLLFDRNRVPSARRRRGTAPLSTVSSVQRLETRNMLAGNVLASLSASGDLTLTGDALANAVDVAVINGDLIVRGRDNTTINGAATAFTVAAGSTTIPDDFFAQLGNGSDVLFVEGVTIGGRASVAGAGGNNSIGFTDSSIGQNIRITSSGGADTVNLDNVQVGRDLTVRTGRGIDTVRVVDTTIGDDAVIVTGAHNDAIVLDNVNVSDDVAVRTGAGADDVVIQNSTVGDRMRTVTGRGNDFVMFDATTVTGKMILRTGAGNDNVVTANGGQFGSIVMNTGAGDDSGQFDSATALPGRSVFRGQEAGVVSTAIRDSELNDATTGALTRATAADDFFSALATAPLSLTVDTSTNSAVQSSGTLVASDPDFELNVTTQPGATVALDSDGDGQFDDGTATADANGSAVLSTALVSNATNNGANVLQVQTSNGIDTPLTEQIDVYLAEGTVVRFDSTLGFWDVELFDDDAPNTVGAFLNDLSRYDNTIIHRNVNDFIIQGGGFSVNGSAVSDAPDFSAPTNESVPANSVPEHSNVRGTLSTAQTSNVNSFTGQWFVNTVNNDGTGTTNNLNNVPHTAFGRVIGDGMTVVDAINNTPDFNVTSLLTNAGALTNVPLVSYNSGDVPVASNFIQINSVTTLAVPSGTENTFRVIENSATGTSVGTLTPATTTTDPVIFQFNEPALPTERRLKAEDHLEGSDAAPVVLIEYISLQCPACAAAHPTVQQLLADNTGDVVVVRRHLPNDTSTGGGFEHSFEAALAAEAAGRQGMFDEMVAELFARQSEWDNSFTTAQAQAVFEDIAVNTLSLDRSQFLADMADQALTDRINRDIADAAALSATATPTFFLTGETQGRPDVPTSAEVQSALQTLAPVFGLDRRTGELTVRDSAALDFEATQNTFTLDITRDNGTSEAIQATVNLIDVFSG